jgi:hypothetical protein
MEGTHPPQPPPGDTFVGRRPTLIVEAEMRRPLDTFVL